jgi:predicted nuclease of predicted toxin-antitoxin system
VTPVRYLFDENCNARIVRGIRRRTSKLDVVTVQEAGLDSADDSTILAHAAERGLVVVSHDARTMIAHATAQLLGNPPMAGLIVIPQAYPVGQAIEDLLLIAEVSTGEEWHGQIVFLPL